MKTVSALALVCALDSPAFAATKAEDPPAMLRGVNLSGAEFGNKVPGRANFDYVWPDKTQISYYAGKGVTVIRLPFRWERLQPHLYSALDPAEDQRLSTAVQQITDAGLTVILDLHNYGNYAGPQGHVLGSPEVPATALADVWERLADQFRTNPLVWFGLMNEPAKMSADQWRDIAQGATNAIRQTGATNKILVPGSAFSTAATWVNSGNAAAFQSFADPGNNFAFEVHQYLDGNYTGTSGSCAVGAGTKRLLAFEAWLQSLPHPAKAFLGEFAAGDPAIPGQENCATELPALLNEVESHPDLWLGWTAWGGGTFWAANYSFRLSPAKNGEESSLMKLYEPYFEKTGVVAQVRLHQ